QPWHRGIEGDGQFTQGLAFGVVVVAVGQDAMDGGLRHAGDARQLILAPDASYSHQSFESRGYGHACKASVGKRPAPASLREAVRPAAAPAAPGRWAGSGMGGGGFS